MTKSKKLISMLLAFVMLVTSCSLSFFAFAAQSDVEEANSLAETALAGININTVQAADTAFINKLNSLSDDERLQVNPVYYTYALHVATTYLVRQSNGNKNPTAKTRADKIKLLADGDATTVANYDNYVKIPAGYIQVIKDFNDLNTRTAVKTTDSVLTTSTGYFQLITAALTNVNFPTNATATSMYETFWNKYKNYTEGQLLFADALVIASYNAQTKADGVTGAFTATIAGNATSASSYDSNLNYFFGNKASNRFALLRYMYDVAPPNAAIMKAKYMSGTAWKDANAPSQYYAEVKDFYTNANSRTVDFFSNYLGEFADAGEGFEGLDNIGDVLDAGLALMAGESVPFATIKDAYEKYEAIKPAGLVLINMISDNNDTIVFNPVISDVTVRGNILFNDADVPAPAEGESQKTAEQYSVDNLTASPGTMDKAIAYSGDKINAVIQAVIDAYDANKGLASFRELVNDTVGKATISADDVTAVWDAFKALSAEDRVAAKAEAELWEKVVQVMTSQFVQYVNGIDLNNVPDAAPQTATDLLNALTVETLDEVEYNFKDYATDTSDTSSYKAVYEKYLQIQIAKFRAYVNSVDLNNVTDENRTQAEALYNALDAEFKAVAQADDALWAKYLAILASEFKDYINSVDLNNVTPAIRQEAQEKYAALSDAAKETAYNDAELWNKYCQIQIPDVDPDNHSEEAAKKADKVTVPSKDESEAIRDLGEAKSIANVQDFLIDDLLPTLTGAIDIKDKNDVVNSALEQYMTNETVGKIYGLYASLSHNKTDMGGITAGELVQTQLIPAQSLVARLYEDKYATAKGKIYQVIANGAIPVDEKGDPEQIEYGTDDDGNALYEDANIYDGIAAIEFKNGDFGFEDGDRDGFIDALLAALRPITGICAPGSPLGIEFFNHVDKKTGKYTLGIYECAMTVLEALGVKGLPTNDAYKANYYTVLQTTYATAEGSEDEKQLKAASIAGDEYLRPVIDAVFAFVDSELHTLNDVLGIIPRLGDLIQSDIPLTVYTSLKADVGPLAGLIETINYQGTDVPLEIVLNPVILPSALLSLINEKLEGLGVTLNMPNWEELNKYTTFKVNRSSQQNKDYVAVRYIKGDYMFSELLYYIYDSAIADDKNCEALKEKVGGLPLVGENLVPFIDNAKAAGKMKTYAAILDYFYETEEEKAAKDKTADAGKSIGETIAGLNETLNLASIDCTNAVVKLSRRKFNYNGKIQKPSVKVTLNGETLKKGIAYKVKYSNASSKKIGKYKVTVTFIGGYEGPDKTFYYTIGPKNGRDVKLTAKKGALKVSWKRSGSKSAKGYVVKYSTSKNFKNAKTVTVKGRNTTSKTIKGLQSGKKYYVKIKAYAVKNGKKIYSTYGYKKAATVK
ncbi:MAG: fibronectin type III domain-containing protein [Eubacterium sp.]|nr:fibronectin type III domain-containing protein [Eubacterium sp.]